MDRPPVDVIVPFRGPADAREALRTRLAALERGPADSVTVVDNTPGNPSPRRDAPVRVLSAPERATPGYARNRGAELGSAPWIAFLDADTDPPLDLLDRYFDPPPGVRTGLVAGGVRDEPVGRRAPAAARYAYLQDAMSQRQTFRLGRWAFAQTANALVRRAALDAVGGFRDDIRAGEDADLTYRLRAAGWEIERRETASVVHRNRQTVRGFVVQKAIHGAGAAWLDRAYPGSFPPRRRPGLLAWGVRHAVAGVALGLRHRDRDLMLRAAFDALEQVTYELGRSLPNRRR